MRVLIMGCGRVGSELSHALGAAGHEVTVIDKRAEAFDRYPPGVHARTIVGLGFDRDVLEEAGIKEADAFIAVSSGDNSNIVSARVALEHYHVPKVIARIFDPQRAEIYERLNIPTVATTTWGVKQFQLMLCTPARRSARASAAASCCGCACRCRATSSASRCRR
jgi:trk system potassium uptake protein TrkA